jgi:hypothetical protein
METWGIGGLVPPFLTSELDEGDWGASLPEMADTMCNVTYNMVVKVAIQMEHPVAMLLLYLFHCRSQAVL